MMRERGVQQLTGDAFAAAAARLNAQRTIRNPSFRQLFPRLQQQPADAAVDELRAYVAAHPDDPDGLALLAHLVAQHGRRREAADLLAGCVNLAPGFAAARFNYADLLFTLNRFGAALEQLDLLLAQDPENPLFRQLKAKALESIGEYAQSREILAALAEENPARASSWIEYGHALRAAGQQEQSITAYRRVIELNPTSGLAYANLANLKIFRFSDDEVVAMQKLLQQSNVAPDDRIKLQFALAKAHEDRGEYARSFEHYAKGNAAVRLRLSYDPDALTAGVRRTTAFFTPEFFAADQDAGCRASDPIFIVGRQRSGSTLIEQILSSHSAIEGTAELPYIPDIVADIAEVEGPRGGAAYFENLAKLSPKTLTALGEQYLQRAGIHRKLGRPYFIDKNPGNHFHLGLIALILPNAKIIDARRNPAAVCWSQFTHHFTMTNLRLTEFARAYRDYIELMAHFDSMLPGRIHRVIYENLVSDAEAEVRQLLDYLGLPFEETCLRFYETERAVLTPSSEQVRRPISREAVDHWRHFEPWLGPMLQTLGSVFTNYPEVPNELR
ncbi:MAG: tetratricopeptide repeat-containing sulfotransferase family protein [Rhizomicrobium sp.]